MDKVLAKFNKTTCEMINDLQSVYPELSTECIAFIEKYKPNEMTSKTFMRYFYNNVYIFSEYIANKNPEFFEKVKPLDNIDVKFLTIDEQHKGNLEIVWKYLDALYLYSYKYIKLLQEVNETLNDSEAVVENLKSMGFDEEFFENQSKLLTQMMENMQSKKDDSTDSSTDKPKLPPELEAMAEKLFGGALGELAKEIAQEIDTSDLNIDMNNPQELFASLLKGDNKNLNSLVNKVSTKFQSKMASGQVNPQTLMAETSNIMADLEKMKDLTGLDPNNLSGLAGMMGGMFAPKKQSNPENLKLLPKNHPKRRSQKP
jgi:hypothetical protein